jgi:F-type H+-transporting ATPase subunit c
MELAAAKAIGAGLAIIGVAGSGVGIGSIFAAFVSATGRNPAMRDALFRDVLLGFALVEALALFAVLVSFVLLFG